MALFTTIATLGTPQDVTAQELRVESFFPMDDETEKTLPDVGIKERTEARASSNACIAMNSLAVEGSNYRLLDQSSVSILH